MALVKEAALACSVQLVDGGTGIAAKTIGSSNLLVIRLVPGWRAKCRPGIAGKIGIIVGEFVGRYTETFNMSGLMRGKRSI